MKVVVHCAYSAPDKLPLSYGMLLAYAKSKLDSAMFDLSLRLIDSKSSIEENFVTGQQNVLLFSNYIWTVEKNLELSKMAKQIDESCVTIHGGPSTPKYELACEDFFHANDHVDIVVRGEGEKTLVETLSAISNLTHFSETINGSTVRSNGKIIRHPERELIGDVNTLPSPYLTGIFDNLDNSKWWGILIETNRGCPYECVYCDWAKSKVRAYDFDRVISEVEWASRTGTDMLYIIDANFGIFKRDLDIARKICEVALQRGYPKRVEACYAKNTKENLLNIIQVFNQAGLINRAALGIQSRDQQTLQAIKRKNIKTDKTDKLGLEFYQLGLKYSISLMFGLPGATPESYMNDLRFYYSQPYYIGINRTVLTPNSPMADPSFRAKYQIEVNQRDNIISTSTMIASEVEEMKVLTSLFCAVHQYHYRLLRFPLVWLEKDYGIDIISLLREFGRELLDHDQYPLFKNLIYDESAHFLVKVEWLYHRMRQRGEWRALHHEFSEWIMNHLQLSAVDFKAFNATVSAQTSMMPSQLTELPSSTFLDHDVAKWYEDVERNKSDFLVNYPPSELKVTETWGIRAI